MADTKTLDENLQGENDREIAPWAKGRTLRNVERDVLIPKIMRTEAKVRCKDLVEEFSKCAKGRTISLIWKCMEQNDAMKNCLAKHYQDPVFFEECKEVYLKQRDEFQDVWKET